MEDIIEILHEVVKMEKDYEDIGMLWVEQTFQFSKKLTQFDRDAVVKIIWALWEIEIIYVHQLKNWLANPDEVDRLYIDVARQLGEGPAYVESLFYDIEDLKPSDREYFNIIFSSCAREG